MTSQPPASKQLPRVLNIEVNASQGTDQFQSALTQDLDLLTPTTPPFKPAADLAPLPKVVPSASQKMSVTMQKREPATKKLSGLQFQPILQHLCDSRAQIPTVSLESTAQNRANFLERQQRKRYVFPASFTNYKLPRTPKPTCLVIMAPVVKRAEHLPADKPVKPAPKLHSRHARTARKAR